MLLFLIFYLAVIPFCVLMHEAGHGLGVILTSKSSVRIYLGRANDSNQESFRIGRMHFHLVFAYGGFAYWDGSLNRRQRMAALAGGPVMSLLLAFSFLYLASILAPGDPFSFFSGVAIFNFLQFLVTIIPVTYPNWLGMYNGFLSDGLQLLRLLKNKSMN